MASIFADANGLDAAAAIERAGMSVKNAKGPSKLPLEVTKGPVPGSLRVRARAAKTRVSYDWQYSLEGVSWIEFQCTVGAHAKLTGLVPGIPVFARHRTVSRIGVSDWSDALSFLVG